MIKKLTEGMKVAMDNDALEDETTRMTERIVVIRLSTNISTSGCASWR